MSGELAIFWLAAGSTLANRGAQAPTVADHFSREAEIAKEVALANAPPLRT